MEQHTSLMATHPATRKTTAHAELQRRLSALREFELQIADEAPDPEIQNAAWESYLVGLENHQYYAGGRSELGEEYEWQTWLRAQLMLKHPEDFARLLEVVYDFVVALTEAGGQRLLGERAGLTLVSRSAQPSDWVQFRAKYPPDPPPLAIADHEKIAGGPKAWAARLIWWCAAAWNPKDFDVVSGFSQSFFLQPFWVMAYGPFGRSTRADPYPLSLIRETAAELVRLVMRESPQQSSAADDEPGVLEDGPYPICMFRYEAIICHLPDTQWKLLDYLWTKRHRRALWENAREDLWGGDASKSAVEAAACRINKEFKAKGIPLRVRFKSRYVILQSEQA